MTDLTCECRLHYLTVNRVSVCCLMTLGISGCCSLALRSGVRRSTTFGIGICHLTALGVELGCLMALKTGACCLTALRDAAYGDVSMDKIRIRYFRLTSVVRLIRIMPKWPLESHES